MTRIVSSNTESGYLDQLYSWFADEWKDVNSFERMIKGLVVPAPLLVLEGDDLLGGLSFINHSKPDSEEIGLWVNAVLISPEYRGRGLATRLIQQASVEAERLGIMEIFVFTGFPALYQKIGWDIVDDSKDDTVLKIAHGEQGSFEK